MLLLTLLSLLTLTAPDDVIEDGYSYPLSVLPGDSLNVYINATEPKFNFTLKLYDLEGSVVAEYETNLFQQVMTDVKPWENGYGYRPTLRIKAPNLKSGVYLWENEIPVIIKRKNPRIVVVYTSNTENAYCNSGGKGLYNFNSTDFTASQVVSFRRPISLPKHSEAFLRWFQQEKFKDVGYITDLELDTYSEWKKADLLMIVGHSEYWTTEARKNFDKFISAGKNVIVLSGNTMWWQVTYSKNKEQMTCLRQEGYRFEHEPVTEGSIGHSLGVDFSRGGYGKKTDKGWDGFLIIQPSPLLENTKLKPGDTLKLASDETDGAPLSGLDTKGYPIIDSQALGFLKAEIIGFDYESRLADGIATWVVFKKSRKSGIVINTATTDWCSQEGMSNEDVRTITLNMIIKLLRKDNVFSTAP